MSTGYQPPIAMQETKTIVPQLDVDQLVQSSNPLASETLRDIRLSMSSHLQTSLELDRLITILFDEIRHAVEVHGIGYKNSAMNVKFYVGRKAKHQANYRLTTDEQDFGEICFSRGRRFREEELQVIESLLDLFIYPLRNALQYKEAIESALTDPLTGAGNRMALASALHREVQMAKRYDLELSVLMIDIDDFKQINDSYGHSAGDQVLRTVAEDIRSTVRNTDICFRYGGEEFLVLLPKTDLRKAGFIAQRIRSIIQTSTHVEGRKDPITVSIGAAELTPGLSQDDLIERADKALYCAKKTGKNKVCSDEHNLGFKQIRA